MFEIQTNIKKCRYYFTRKQKFSEQSCDNIYIYTNCSQGISNSYRTFAKSFLL